MMMSSWWLRLDMGVIKHVDKDKGYDTLGHTLKFNLQKML